METITIHPRTKEETILFENLAKALQTPYQIKETGSAEKRKKKPSDYFGTLSKKDGQKMVRFVKENRDAWNRNT